MKIGELLEDKGRKIISVDGTVPVSEAIAMMVKHNIGAVVIQGEGNPEGIFTERDALRLWSEKEKVQDTPINEIMTKGLIVTNVDDTLMDALSVMIQKNIRHLLVVEDAKVTGLLSIRDLAKEQVKNTRARIRLLEDVLASEISKNL